MSPKRRVILLTSVLGALGISVSVIIIAIGGGFSGSIPSLLNPPSSADLWTVGEGVLNGSHMAYVLTAVSPAGESLVDSVISMDFMEEGDDTWKVNFTIMNGTLRYTGNVLLSKEYLTNKQAPEGNLTAVYRLVESSLFDVRNFAREPKYLFPGAIWDTISSGALTSPLRISAQDSITVDNTSVPAYILQYEFPSETSRIWLAHDFPLPIKADVGNASSSTRYVFELQGNEGS